MFFFVCFCRDQGVTEQKYLTKQQSNSTTTIKTPKYNLMLDVVCNCINGQVIFDESSDVNDSLLKNQLVLFVGEDRIILKNQIANYNYLDIFVPVIINQYQTSAQFDGLTKILTFKLPLLSNPI